MAKNFPTKKLDLTDGKIEDMDRYVYNLYYEQIEYYKQKGAYNKKYYKNYRALTIILGALVTLIASMATSKIVTDYVWLDVIFTVTTPVLAASLTIINGLSQNFQWGAAWRDMSVNAQRLEKERDRFLATPVGKRNYKNELNILNDIVLQETRAFFQRVLDSEVVPTETPRNGDKKEHRQTK